MNLFMAQNEKHQFLHGKDKKRDAFGKVFTGNFNRLLTVKVKCKFHTDIFMKLN